MSIGVWQIILVLVIIMILFGAGKLPRVMGDLAKGVKSFKSGLRDDEDEQQPPRPIDQSRTSETQSDRRKDEVS